MMNPETNRFEAVFPKRADDDDVKEQKKLYGKLMDELVRQDGSPVPKEYPIYKVGEKFRLKGYCFEIKSIGEDELVLKPVGPMPTTKVKHWSKKQSGRAQKSKRKKRR